MSYHFFSLPPDSCFSLLLNVWQFDVCTINSFPGVRIDLPRGDRVLHLGWGSVRFLWGCVTGQQWIR
jgi:hypothetical protein